MYKKSNKNVQYDYEFRIYSQRSISYSILTITTYKILYNQNFFYKNDIFETNNIWYAIDTTNRTNFN